MNIARQKEKIIESELLRTSPLHGNYLTMRITKIHIQRFSGIRELTIEIGKALQLVAGPNNSCKSTLLRAISLFFEGPSDLDPSKFSPQNSYYEAESNRALTVIRIHFSDLSESEMEVFVDAWLPRNKEIWFELRITRSGSIEHKCSNNAAAKALYESLLSCYEVIYVPAVRAGQSARTEQTQKLFLATKEVLAKKRRGALGRLQNDFYTAGDYVTTILDSLLENSKLAISESISTDLEIAFQFPSSSRLLDLILSETTIGTRVGTSLTIDDEGTGFQSLLALGLLKYIEGIARDENLLILTEEPEAFLHPQLQRSVALYLKSLAKTAQVIVTTHSAVLVDSVDILNIVRLIRSPQGLKYNWNVEAMDPATLGRLNRYCDAKNSEIVFADKVILCEGISDWAVLTRLVDSVTSGNHHKMNISVIHGDGSALRYVAQLLDLFKVDHKIVLDKDCLYENRSLIKQICNDKGKEIAVNEFNKIDRLMNSCVSISDALEIRDSINEMFKSRAIFILSSDIEGSVCYSFSKKRLLQNLGPEKLHHFTQQSVDDLAVKSGEEFASTMYPLIGSKGWRNGKKNSDNKPKHHVLGELLTLCGVENARAASDISAIKLMLNDFLIA